MARKFLKNYEFQCDECRREFKAMMWSEDSNYNGTYVSEGVDCECGAKCFPEGSVRPEGINMVTDKDVRTGNWVHKLPSDWKDLQNRIAQNNRSSMTTMEKI